MERTGGDSASLDASSSEPSPLRCSASSSTPAPRHYPVDLPDAPFHRFEHRLTARDVMIHRIMSDIMKPSRVSPKTYDSYISHPATFGAVSSQDRELGADLRCVQKSLFTLYADTPLPKSSPMIPIVAHDYAGCCGIRRLKLEIEGPRNKPPLLCDQVLDLVRRHYFETDTAILRAWISNLGPVPIPSSGRRTHAEPQSWSYGISHPPSGEQPVIIFGARIGRFPRAYGHWTRKDTAHIHAVQSKTATQTRLPLYDGGVFIPYLRRSLEQKAAVGTRRGPRDNRWMLNQISSELGCTVAYPEERGAMRFILQPSWEEARLGEGRVELLRSKTLDMSLNPGRGRNSDGIWSTGQRPNWGKERGGQGRYGRLRKRSTSLPPPGSFTSANVGIHSPVPPFSQLQVIFPRMTLAQMDRRSRRRSLSRTRIEEMFDWDTDLVGMGVVPAQDAPKPQPRCDNCADPGHSTTECTLPCGYCGAPNPESSPPSPPPGAYWDGEEEAFDRARVGRHMWPHLAPECPVAPQNRCKCIPFPTFHVAARCGVVCRRDCGAQERPGHFRHHNAMLCRSRCCMCGIHGHSGKECRLRRCRCGGAHLGQDCGWNPTCRVKGCPRFLCGIHCRECGSTEKPFVNWLCAKCSPVLVPAEERRGRRRRRKPSMGAGDKEGGDNLNAETAAQFSGEAAEPPRHATGLVSPVPSSRPENPPSSIFGGPRILKEGSGRDK
ncbi:hypothetical protein B0T16DRAFT_459544 [Cercophora newfieldiana]|uniref:Uncharacterized protein n=1 Tax=Cercophora newfieldiana TaxID=92897 RepID=A0AA39Y1Z4_9PEZI|nr:hypothetical protein B0T16DRAFT_459544 [Cercophora newfieldiana]